MAENTINPYLRGINWLHARILKELETAGERLDDTLEAKVQEAKTRFSNTDIVELCKEDHNQLNEIVYELSKIFNARYRKKQKPNSCQSIYFDAPFERRGWEVEWGTFGQSKDVQTSDKEKGITDEISDNRLYLGKDVFIYGLQNEELTKFKMRFAGPGHEVGVAKTTLIGPRKYEGVKIQSEQMARELFAKLEEDYALSTICELRILCGKDVLSGVPLYVNLRALPSYKPTVMDRLLKRV